MKVRIMAQARAKYTKIINFKNEAEGRDFINASDGDIICNIDEHDDIDWVDDFEVIDVSEI